MAIGVKVIQKAETPKEFRMTGLKVLAITVGFFATVIGVNLLMAFYAVSTFSGLQSDKPYESGLAFNHAIADAKAQAERHWTVDVGVARATDGTVTVNAHLRDAHNLALAGYDVRAGVLSPIDRNKDHRLVLTDLGDGSYGGTTTTDAGQWDIEIEARREGAVLFHSVSRVILR